MGMSSPIIRPRGRHQAPAAMTSCREPQDSPEQLTVKPPPDERVMPVTSRPVSTWAPRTPAAAGEGAGGLLRVGLSPQRKVHRSFQLGVQARFDGRGPLRW